MGNFGIFFAGFYSFGAFFLCFPLLPYALYSCILSVCFLDFLVPVVFLFEVLIFSFDLSPFGIFVFPLVFFRSTCAFLTILAHIPLFDSIFLYQFAS